MVSCSPLAATLTKPAEGKKVEGLGEFAKLAPRTLKPSSMVMGVAATLGYETARLSGFLLASDFLRRGARPREPQCLVALTPGFHQLQHLSRGRL